MIAPHNRSGGGKVKGPTAPLEVTSVEFDGAGHEVAKQLRAECVNGVDHWQVETACGRRIIITLFAVRNTDVTCRACATSPVRRTRLSR